jgi:hypothetical protein
MSKHWTEWRYLTGLEILHPFNGGAVHINDYTKNFDEWRSIISHCVNKACPNFLCHMRNDSFGVLICQFHDDANAQIVIETLEDWCKNYPGTRSLV